MKRIIIAIIAIMAVAYSANAQKSPWYVGGNVGLSVSAAQSGNIGWNVSPEVGYVIKDNMSAGVGISLGGTRGWSSGSTGSTSLFNFMVQPYYRWEFAKVKSLKFLLDGVLGLGSATTTYRDSSAGAKYSVSDTQFAWGVAVAPAIAYDITNQWSIITTIASVGVSGIGNSCAFSFMAIRGPSIGVEYRF